MENMCVNLNKCNINLTWSIIICFQVEEALYDIPRLFSDIGGILGLWAGTSVIAIVESSLMLVEIVKTCSKKNHKNVHAHSIKSSTNLKTYM